MLGLFHRCVLLLFTCMSPVEPTVVQNVYHIEGDRSS